MYSGKIAVPPGGGGIVNVLLYLWIYFISTRFEDRDNAIVLLTRSFNSFSLNFIDFNITLHSLNSSSLKTERLADNV
jgi:hypothetical protein